MGEEYYLIPVQDGTIFIMKMTSIRLITDLRNWI
jgi:hypothetical protein